MKIVNRTVVSVIGLMATLYVLPASATVAIDNTPLSKATAVPGNLVLVPSVEWPTVVTQANDPGVAETSATYSTAPVTSCPSGYTLNGGSCEMQVAATAACPDSSWTLSGSTCTQTTEPNTSTSNSSTTATLCTNSSYPYFYNNGSTLRCQVSSSNTSSRAYNSTCSASTTSTTVTTVSFPSSGTNRSCTLSTTTTNYSCPSGYNSSGSGASFTCSKTQTATYSCPTGTARGSGSSMICITATATPTTVLTPYAGYFNPGLCYAYHYATEEKNRYFYPVSNTTTDGSGNAYICAGQTGGTYTQKLWSGNFLNWATMQAIDTFRLALTGGYRVHVPETGTPPNVSIVDSGGATVSKATSEMPDVTFLEKANSDRWDDSYTKLRRLTANAGNATPTATASFRTRIGALRNQMWFIPDSSGGLGDAESYSNPQPVPLPVADGSQTTVDGDGPALPYDPGLWAAGQQLPNADTTTTTNSTACATGEVGCSTATYSCPSGPSGTNTTGTCAAQSATACSNSSYRYFRTSGKLCRSSNNDTSSSQSSNALCSVAGATIPSNGSTGGSCSLGAYAGTASTFTHTTYGRNQIYAVSIRVKVCDGTLDRRSMCTQYGSNYKPEGLLQKNSKKIRYSLFSYLTETGQVRDGGVMRARMKLIGPVTTAEQAGTEKPYPDRSRISGIDNPEWDPVTGVFINNPDTTDSTATNSNIGSCTDCQVQYSGVINYLNRFGQINTGQATLKSYDNLSEMYYTALRYLRGEANFSAFSNLTKASSGSDLAGTGALAKYQNADGLPVIDDWYKTGANSAVRKWNTTPALSVGTDGDPILYQCQTTVMLGIGDTHTNNEDDASNKTYDGVAAGGTYRSYTEFNSGGNGRGNLAGLAYWAHLNDTRPDVPNNDVSGGATDAKSGQTVSTYWVDVVEQNDLFAKTTNQFYNTTKYGGYVIPAADWGTDGNARRHDTAWFDSNTYTWTTATQTVKAQTGLGGTGDYYLPSNMFLANNGQKMIDGLNAAFTRIADDLSGSGASLAANSTKLATDTTTYQAVYFNRDWRGDIKAFAVDSSGTIAQTPTWQASSRLPAAANRNIKTCTGSCASASDLVDFKTTASFDSKNQLCLTPASCGSGEADSKINYLRGSATDEQRNGGTLRNRTSPLGDIIDSQPVFVGAPNVNLYAGKTFGSEYAAFANSNDVKTRRKLIYVAANDGMLHAFNAETSGTNPAPGQEMFAYLPRAVIQNSLYRIALPTYGDESQNAHAFYNDGELTVADVKINDAWRSVLIGTTGRGSAKAVYALDVTDPAAITLLWERSASDGKANSNFIGQIVGKPVLARVSGGTWVALMGNGYNSAYGKPALLQFDLASGSLTSYTTSGSSDDGLSPPAVWISDATLNDNISTQAYAGDLHGNVWEFQLAASGPNNGSATQKMFIAKDSSGNTQPITAGLVAAKNSADNAVWVFFGTGSFLATFSASDGIQTWYGLIVQGANKVSSTNSLSDLRQRKIVAESTASTNRLATRGISEATDGDMANKKGWYIQLLPPSGSAKGERMVTPNQFQASLLIGTTRIPTSSDPCQPSGNGWIMAIDPFTGTAPSADFFDVNNDGSFNNSDRTTYTDENGVTHTVISAGVGFTSIPNNPIFVSHTMLISFDNATTGRINTRSGPTTLQRVSWRELIGR